MVKSVTRHRCLTSCDAEPVKPPGKSLGKPPRIFTPAPPYRGAPASSGQPGCFSDKRRHDNLYQIRSQHNKKHFTVCVGAEHNNRYPFCLALVQILLNSSCSASTWALRTGILRNSRSALKRLRPDVSPAAKITLFFSALLLGSSNPTSFR